jgi:hypothetical protein
VARVLQKLPRLGPAERDGQAEHDHHQGVAPGQFEGPQQYTEGGGGYERETEGASEVCSRSANLVFCVDLYTAMNLVESHVGVLNKILREPGDDDGKRKLLVRCAPVLLAWIDVLGSFMPLQ